MSRKQSAYLKRVDIERKEYMKAAERTREQFLVDTASIALNNLGWGEKRVREFLAEWGKVHDEFYDAMRDIPEADYYRAKLDDRLKPLCKKEKLIPFKDRYDFLPEEKY